MRKEIKNNQSFTLVELLVVIGILAILTATVILVINPVEYLKQTRDSVRMSDLSSINQALSVLESQGATSFGSANTVYVSLPDTTSTCANLGLPALPSTWSYHCAPTSTLQNTNGTGWIPVDFTQSLTLSFSNLPIDPINSTSTGNYYTYVTGGSWDLATSFESSKYKLGGGADKASTDGGQYPDLYEVGSNKTLLPVDYGDASLIGYWPLNEGSGTTAYDASGHGNSGTWQGTPSGSNGTYYTTSNGKTVGYFDGTDDYINILNSETISGSFTVIARIKSNISSGELGFVGTRTGVLNTFDFRLTMGLGFAGWLGDGTNWLSGINSSFATDMQFNIAAIAVSSGNFKTYLNGTKVEETNYAGSVLFSNGSNPIDIGQLGVGYFFNGLIDDVRIYNRALSASEISALYNATR